MKNVAISKELAIQAAQLKNKTEIVKTENSSVLCGCGQTDAIKLTFSNNEIITVGFCTNCGSEFFDEIDLL